MKALSFVLLLSMIMAALCSCGGTGGSGGSGSSGGGPGGGTTSGITMSLPQTLIGEAGTTCTVPLSINDPSTVAGFDITVKVDSAVLAPVDVQIADAPQGALIDKTITADSIRVVMAGAHPVATGITTMVNLFFTVKGSAAPGSTSALVFQNTVLYSAEPKKIDNVGTSDGLLTVQ